MQELAAKKKKGSRRNPRNKTNLAANMATAPAGTDDRRILGHNVVEPSSATGQRQGVTRGAEMPEHFHFCQRLAIPRIATSQKRLGAQYRHFCRSVRARFGLGLATYGSTLFHHEPPFLRKTVVRAIARVIRSSHDARIEPKKRPRLHRVAPSALWHAHGTLFALKTRCRHRRPPPP